MDTFTVVTVESQREIDCCFFNSHQEVKHLAQTQKWKKLLYFCNLRESVEEVAADLSSLWRPYPVVPHHGSLSRRLREEAETVMKEAQIAVCVATSTLEIGIDIGDIDLVVMAEVPWSVSALLQRIGRGNRRENVVHTAVVTTSDQERLLFEAMLQTARSGSLPSIPYQPDLSVAIQQIFSYLYQYPRGVPENELVDLLSLLCTEDQIRLILGHLQAKGWIEWQVGRWCATTRLMDQGEKGQIHSNIFGGQDYRVVDVSSGVEVGRVAGVVDEVFVLGRRAWQIVSVVGNTIRARRFEGPASAPFFKRHKEVGAFYYLLPRELKIS